MKEPTFTLFPRLPAELRRLVWQAALPTQDPPTVYYANWRLFRHYSNSSDVATGKRGMISEPTDHSPYVSVTLPQLRTFSLVNREAHDVMVDWKRARGITMHEDDKERRILVRPWKPERDALYVARGDWEDFCDVFDNQDQTMGAAIHHLALPAFTAYYSIAMLGSLLEFMPNIRTVYAIWDELPVWERKPSDSSGRGTRVIPWQREVQPRWELENAKTEDDDGDGYEPAVLDTEGDRVDKAVHNDKVDDKDDGNQVLDEDSDDDDAGRKTGQMVKMLVRDPVDDSTSYQVGELQEWMDEIFDQFSITEVPAHVVDEETGELTLDIWPVNVVKM